MSRITYLQPGDFIRYEYGDGSSNLITGYDEVRYACYKDGRLLSLVLKSHQDAIDDFSRWNFYHTSLTERVFYSYQQWWMGYMKLFLVTINK